MTTTNCPMHWLWEIVSYERMTDMIFSSYMATKSPETSGKGIIAAIEKRIK